MTPPPLGNFPASPRSNPDKEAMEMVPDRVRAGPGIDPRLYQIAVLAGLLIYGIGWLDLEVQPALAVAMLGTALGTQWLCSRLFRLPWMNHVGRFDVDCTM